MPVKTITIAIPIYNVEKYLPHCLDSIILNQNYDDVEVLLINDGSPSSEDEICMKYVNKYPYMKYISKENGGYGSVINYAVKVANGKYFKMLDSDDMYDQSFLSDYLDFVRQSDSDLIINDVSVFDDCTGDQFDDYSCEVFQAKTFEDVNLLGKRLFLHNFAIRTSLIRGIVCPEKCLYTDAALLCYGISRAKTVSSSGINLYKYRLGRNGQSASKEVVLKHIKDYQMVYQHICACYSGRRLPYPQLDFFFEILDCVLNNYIRFTIGVKKLSAYSDVALVMKQYKDFKKRHKIATSSESKTVKLLSKSVLYYFALIPKFSGEIK